jgi:hypothetical protein
MSSLRKYTFNLGAFGGGDDLRVLDVSGPILAVLESSAAFLISFDGEAPIPGERGLKFRRPFNKIMLTNTSALANSVSLLIGDGDIEDYRVRPQIASTSKTIFGGNTTGITAGTALLAELANANRVSVQIYGAVANVSDVYLISAQAASKGFAVSRPGVPSALIPYTGDVYVLGVNAADFASVYATYY